MNAMIIGMNEIAPVEALFTDVFTGEPWNDDWSDRAQLRAYLTDIMGCPNSLSFALHDGANLVGASLGSVIHWYAGTEYYIREFFVATRRQHGGLGSLLLRSVEEAIASRGVKSVVLNTERNVPAYGFYVKNGFAESSETRFLYKNV